MTETRYKGSSSQTVLGHNSLLGTACMLLSPYEACEVVSISKTNRWEAGGYESFADRSKPQ